MAGMANEVVWFKNRQTGAVTAVPKGSPHHRRLLTTVTLGDEPEPVWSETKPPKTSTTTYQSGQVPATVHTVKRPTADAEAPEAEPEPPAEPQK